MKDKLMNLLKRRRKRKDRYERLSNESLEKRLAFNAAPVLTDADLQFASFGTGDVAPVGEVGVLVSSLIDSGGTNNNYFDADGDAPGIAITDLNLNDGNFWMTTNNGENWVEISDIGNGSAYFLYADNSSRIYYQSAHQVDTTINNLVEFVAWDRSFYQNGDNGSLAVISQIGQTIYGEEISDLAGRSVSISADGSIIAIGATLNDGNGERSGHTRVFRLTGDTWQQLGEDIDGEEEDANSGCRVALSADGLTLAIGSKHFGNVSFNDQRGQARVFRWNGDAWEQIGNNLRHPYEYSRNFGVSVALNSDGSVLVVTEHYFGSVVYELIQGEWVQKGDLLNASPSYHATIDVSENGDTVAINEAIHRWDGERWNLLGEGYASISDSHSVSLSGDGNVVAAAHDDRTVGVYAWKNNDWEILGELISVDSDSFSPNEYGVNPHVSLTNDGTMLAIGTPNGSATGLMRLYGWDGVNWSQVGNDIVGVSASDGFGWDVSISSNGNRVIVGAERDQSRGSVTVFEIADKSLRNAVSKSSDRVRASLTSIPRENDRPSLVVTPSITMIDAAVGSSLPSETSGIAVSDIIDAGGVLNNFSDQDQDSAGIAITDTQLDGGTLWFTTDGGATWTDVGDVAEHSARVLVADGTTKLYFQTSTDSAPALEEVFTFKAWDLTGGWNNGDSKVNTSQVTALTSDSTSGVYDGPAFDSPHYASDIKMSPDGRLAYVLDPTLGVHIFDVSTPNEIVRLTDYLASGDVNDITFSSDSNYAFIAMGDGGVQIVDISTPSSPVLKTTIATTGEAVAVELTSDDKKLYVAMGSVGVEVYDLDTVESPVLRSTLSTGKDAVSLFIESRFNYTVAPTIHVNGDLYDDYLFVANGDGGITIIDAASLTVLQHLDLDGSAYDLTMSADGQLLVASGDSGLHVVDISWTAPITDPDLPQIPDQWTTLLPNASLVSTVELPGRAYSVETSEDGRYAIVSANETGVHAVDVSKPDSPSIAWSWNTPGQAYGTAVSADGRFLFVADGDEGIRSQEINFLDDVRSLATDSAATQTVFSADGKRAYSIAGSYLYVNELGSDGEWTTVYENRLVDQEVYNYTHGWQTRYFNGASICLSGNEEFLFIGTTNTILTFSLEGERPEEVGRVTTNKHVSTRSLMISQDGRYLISDYFEIFDTDNPSALIPVEINLPSNLRATPSIVSSSDGSIVFTASTYNGVAAYDATNATDIFLLDRYDLSSGAFTPKDLAISQDNNVLFIASGSYGLNIVDSSDPSDLKFISRIDTPYDAVAVTLSQDGRYAFVADGTSGTHVIDVQNLTAPKLIGQIYSSANAKNVEMSADGTTLVVSGDEGIQFISMESSISFSTESDVVGTLMNSAPTSITATGTVIAENSAVGTVAGYLTAADADVGDSVTFTLVQGEGDNDNNAFEISGNEIRATKILDYEAQRDYTIRVRATDSAGAFKEERIQLAVTDVVETPTGTPLILTAAEGVISIDAEITFDPTKIDLQRVDVADGLPQGAIATVNVVSPGRALFGVSLPGALGDRPYVLGYLKANLVGDETGAPEDLLVMSNVRFNEGNISSTSPVGIDLLRVGNAAPTLITITSTTVSEGSNVGTAIGNFSTADADAGDLVFYELASGEGGIDNAKFTIENGTLKTKVRLDYETATSHSIRVRATDAAGEFVEQAFTVSVEDVADGLSVVSVTPSSSGVKIEFSEALDTSELNVLSTPGFSGGSDIQLLGSTTGFVKGSLVVSSDLQTIDFVATGGMSEDTYTLIVSSGVNGFKAQSGALLDGNADGVTGDNYLSFIDLTSAPQAIVGIESFARAPGEQASASLASDGVLNLNVETTETVSAIDFTLSYNPELLDVEAVNLGGEAPAGATVTYSVVAPGEIAVEFRSSTPLQAGVANFIAIDAGVLAEATYGEVGLLEVQNVSVNAGAVTSGGKSGVQVVAKLGDANGDTNHSTIDSILAANLATRPNRGLASYPLIDPSVVTDVSGSGQNTMFDSALIATANRVEDVMGPTIERSVDSENPRTILYRQDGEYGSVTLPRLQGAMAARASAFIQYSLGSNPQAQALFASYGADMESADGDDDDKKNWLPDPGMIGSGG